MYSPLAPSNPQRRPQRRRSAKQRHQQRELAKLPQQTLAGLENHRFAARKMATTPKFIGKSASSPKLFFDPRPSEWAPLKASKHSQNTVNPIRRVTDCMAVAPNPEKAPIRLNLGDPTVTGCLPPSKATLDAIRDALDSHKFDGYGPATGIPAAREAIVKHFSRPEAPFTADDVVLASGCSHALEMAIVAIADPGQNILVPQPGFPLYTTLCTPNGIETRQYRLKMEEDGLVDLAHLEGLIDENTRAIIVNNPSNPTGVVFPKEHLEQILRLAQKHKLPIIADEIYGDLVYAEGAQFHPMASLSPRVPIISCDGIGKRYLVPGWRLGWLIVHDRFGVLEDVKRGIVALSQKIVGPCALVQGALPRILADTPPEFFERTKKLLAANADIVYDVLSRVPGLRPLRPQGAMYCMVGIEPTLYGEESEFIQKLIQEESVYCLPGSAFSLPNWFRLVLAFPEETTREACERIAAFCFRHLRPCTEQLAAHWESTRREAEDGSEGSVMGGTETDLDSEE